MTYALSRLNQSYTEWLDANDRVRNLFHPAVFFDTPENISSLQLIEAVPAFPIYDSCSFAVGAPLRLGILSIRTYE